MRILDEMPAAVSTCAYGVFQAVLAAGLHHMGLCPGVGIPTVSAAPKHIALQLIERACSEHYIEAVLGD